MVLMSACSDGGADPFGPPESIGGGTAVTTANGGLGDGSWTVLVYLDGDNNLEFPALMDLKEMQQGYGDNVNIVVLLDRAANDEAPYTGDPVDGVGSFSGARLLYVGANGIEVLGTGDAATSDPATLAQVGTLAFQKYPADHYAVSLWDHGGAWHGFAVDESSGGEAMMTIDEVQSGLQQIVDNTGIGKLDMVIFDACLMGEFEIAEAMRPVADYMIASEEVVPGHSLDYRVLDQAAAGGDPVTFGTVLIDAFKAQADNEFPNSAATVTMSLFDLSKMQPLADAIGGLQQALAADPSAAVEFFRAVDASAAFAYDPDPAQNYHMRDLGQITDQLASGGSSLAGAAGQISGALDDVVLYHIEGSGHTGAEGMSVYAPISIEHFRSDFNDVSTSPLWSGVLDAAYGGGADSMTGIDATFTQPAQAVFEDGVLSIGATVDPSAVGSVSSVTVLYCAFVPAQDGFPDLCLMLGRTSGGVLDAANGVVGGAIPLLQLGISADGGGSGLLGVYSPIPSPDGQTPVLSVPVRYMAPGASVDEGLDGYLLLTLDANLNVVQRSLLLQAENGTLAEVTPDPAGTIQTIVLQISPDGSVEPIPSEMYTDPPSLPAALDALSIVVVPRSPGDGSPLTASLGVGVVIVDAGGTTHITFAPFSG